MCHPHEIRNLVGPVAQVIQDIFERIYLSQFRSGATGKTDTRQ